MENNVVVNNLVADTIKGITSGVAGVCTAKLVVDIIENTAPVPVTPAVKVIYGIGGYVIGDMVGEAACNHVAKAIDAKAVLVAQVKTAMKAAKVISNNQTENPNN